VCPGEAEERAVVKKYAAEWGKVPGIEEIETGRGKIENGKAGKRHTGVFLQRVRKLMEINEMSCRARQKSGERNQNDRQSTEIKRISEKANTYFFIYIYSLFSYPSFFFLYEGLMKKAARLAVPTA